MATKKPPVNPDEQLPDQDLEIFDVLNALDKKDYGFYDRLSEAQQKKFAPYVIIQWLSSAKGEPLLQQYLVCSTEVNANKYFLNEKITPHPKLQWLMLCAASPGIGKQRHQWIYQLKLAYRELREAANKRDISDYFKKIYPTADTSTINEVATEYVDTHKKQVYLANEYPTLKRSDIDTLANLISHAQISENERQKGN